MALDLGDLTATLRVDRAEFERGLQRAENDFDEFADDLIRLADAASGSVDRELAVDGDQFQDSLNEQQTRMQRWGDRMQVAAAAAGAAIGAALITALVDAMEIDEARVRMEAMLLDPGRADALGKAAGKVYGRGFTETAGEAYDALAAVASSKLVPSGTAAAYEDIAVKAQTLARILGVDVADAVMYANSLLGHGLARDGTQAFDLILAAAKRVPAALREDLLQTADEYAGYFHSLGFSGEQAFALLAAGAQRGAIVLDKMGDVFKEFTLLATTSDAAEVMRAIGLDARQMSNDLLAGGERAKAAFDKIVGGLQAVKDPTERADLALKFFGTPLEDLDKRRIPEFLAALAAGGQGLGDFEGGVKRTGDALENSAGQQLTAFKNAVSSALVEQVAKALPYLANLAKWGNANKAWLEPTVGVLGSLAVVIGTVVAVTKVWTAVQMALNVVMAMNPIGLLILGIGLLVAEILLLWHNCEGFRNAVTALWEGLVTGAKMYWEVTKAVWGGIADFFVGWWNLFTGTWSKVFDAIGTLIGWVVDRWNGLVDFVTGLPGRITAAARGMWDGVKEAFRSAVNWIIGRWNSLSLRIPAISIPGIGQVWGGMTLRVPGIPMLATGGDILRTGLAMVHAGERVIPAAQTRRRDEGRGAGGPAVAEVRGTIWIRGDGLLSGLREEVAIRGGNVQAVLGGGSYV